VTDRRQGAARPNVLAGVFSFAYAVPFLLLLLGTPGKARTIVGGVVGGVLIALIYVGLAMQRQ
jgi:hypothetical protein